MKKAMLLVAVFGLVAAQSCRSTNDEVQPRSYDALALSTGHWEWEKTSYQAGNRTPTTEGFTRQLVFNADGQVTIQHNSKLNKTTDYQLSMGNLPKCGAPQVTVPIINFETDSDVPNNDRKTYRITKTPDGQQLSLVGEAACLDGGAYEFYHWVAE
ncbi:hypothetical protein GO988_02830 [Hymenobacter sp. HMF4947]|uniref:Lipocalin-like domain-containing protein n=1 Tax=Hymenobacter ginkgonis TaxID=2682976 RepID=A0A7K1TAN6_9BACT|nr:hypothetical protein [Hymenobacter ginkgonis]MVN75251.1 hypothetical protein [Hymenobacter ginkgonis]